jgi:hypothetical protein
LIGMRRQDPLLLTPPQGEICLLVIPVYGNTQYPNTPRFLLRVEWGPGKRLPQGLAEFDRNDP